MRRNHLVVHIFFGKMSYQILEEEPAYTFITMMGMFDIAFLSNSGFCSQNPSKQSEGGKPNRPPDRSSKINNSVFISN